jgi:hypothetical protein
VLCSKYAECFGAKVPRRVPGSRAEWRGPQPGGGFAKERSISGFLLNDPDGRQTEKYRGRSRTGNDNDGGGEMMLARQAPKAIRRRVAQRTREAKAGAGFVLPWLASSARLWPLFPRLVARAGSEEANCRFLHLRRPRPSRFCIGAWWFHVEHRPAGEESAVGEQGSAGLRRRSAVFLLLARHAPRLDFLFRLIFVSFGFSDGPASLSLDGRAGSEAAPCFDGQAEAKRDGRAWQLQQSA